MSTTVEHETIHNLNQAKRRLADKIKEMYASLTSPVCITDKLTVSRVEVPVNDILPLWWLAVQKSPMKTYWSDRHDEFEMAGIGEADVISWATGIDYDLLHNRLSNCLKAIPEATRYYGGIIFSDRVKNTTNAALWGRFGSYRFIMPRFELFRQSEGTHLACNMVVGPEMPGIDTILGELEEIVFPSELCDAEIPIIISRSDNPDHKQWTAMVNAALESIDETELEKLVLAKRTLFEFSDQLDPICLLQRLKQVTAGCYHFGFQIDDNLAFIGATPERLYRRDGRTIRSEAVGGTRPRGANAEVDDVLARDLLNAEKDRREHRYVTDSVGRALGLLCQNTGYDDKVTLLKLATVQHLITAFDGLLASEISDTDILRTLHPTPAVGGYPPDFAIEKILQIESFDRGWYAGPVGWVAHNAAEFAVAIRSGLIAKDKLYLFAGAGIVKGSTAESEWDEIETKLSSFTKLLIKQ